MDAVLARSEELLLANRPISLPPINFKYFCIWGPRQLGNLPIGLEAQRRRSDHELDHQTKTLRPRPDRVPERN